MMNIIQEYFCKMGKKFCEHLTDNINALMKSGAANTYAMARELSRVNGKSFKTNEMAVYRFLQDEKFQIDDKFWRCHISTIFESLKANKVIEERQLIQVNIDYTTHEDHFLILSASIILADKAITIYFSSRVYPKKKGKISCKKMEEAFIKGLRHVLSKKYEYVIVADRGFGNQRFAKLCKENGFDYVLRISCNLNIRKDEIASNLKEEITSSKFEAIVPRWKERYNFTIAANQDSIWYLIGSCATLDAKTIYEKRFKIEKNFQDCKSNGYDIEKNKIRKYDRFKRMMYLVVLAQALTTIIGYSISKSANSIKKNSYENESINLKLILVFSGLAMKHFDTITRNPLIDLSDFSYHD